MIGKTIDEKYEIRQLIGEGAMGAVYEARHTETDRRVALKLITHAAAEDAKLVKRLDQDIGEAAKLITPYIVEVLDEGKDSDSGHPYVATELLRGENVRALLERLDHLAPDAAARLAGQVCLGLAKAHAAGLIHRDLKPANLFLVRADDGARSIKLLDFGIGRLKMDHALTTGNKSLVRGLSMLGSPLYMSPEQAACEDEIDHRSDIWSLGIVLYELLVGAPPHKKAKSLDELIEAIGADEPPPLRDQAEWVAPELADAVHAALRLDPKDRYQSAEEMCRALEAYVPSSWRISEDHLVALTDEQRSPWSPEEDTRRVKLAALVEADERRDEPEVGDEAAAEDQPAGDAGDAAKDDDGEHEGEEAAGSSPPAADVAEQAEDEPEPAAKESRDQSDSAAPAGAAETIEPADPPGRRGSKAIVFGAVVGVLAVIGYVVVGLGDGPAETASPAATAAATSAAGTSSGGGTDGATATTSDSNSDSQSAAADAGPADDGGGDAAEADAQTVRLKITPAFAAVAVDGERAKVLEGYVELTGEVGSVHPVVVTVAGKSKTVRVTLTADGPTPPHIIFVPGGGGRRPKAAVDDDLYE